LRDRSEAFGSTTKSIGATLLSKPLTSPVSIDIEFRRSSPQLAGRGSDACGDLCRCAAMRRGHEISPAPSVPEIENASAGKYATHALVALKASRLDFVLTISSCKFLILTEFAFENFVHNPNFFVSLSSTVSKSGFIHLVSLDCFA